MKYFYEKSKFHLFKSNKTYHEVLHLSNDDFVEWVKLLRSEVIDQWDMNGTPPVIGRDEIDIIEDFRKLKSNPCDFLHKDFSGDDDSLGIIQNFNKDASGVNQFFPTMLKTKISVGKSASGGLSIYDHFALPEMEDVFIKIMRRAIKRDSMYSFSRSVVTKKDENPFWNGQTAEQFLRDVSMGKIFEGEYKNLSIWIAKMKQDTVDNYGTVNDEYLNHTNLYLTANQVQSLKDEGILLDEHLVNVDTIEDSITNKNGVTKTFHYLIRWYDKTTPIFPKILQVFRLSCGQPAVNFPPLTAKWLYEKYTSHIKDDLVTIYDSSAGWGGRILGAMSARKRIHYIGTDPNMDNFIPELGISRYEYLANFYNENCVDNDMDSLDTFFNVESQANTFELFQDGSELIHNNPKFQKYKGKLDLSFTSPPYFNREQYSQQETQSFLAYSEYDDWRDNFLKPTLTTIFDYTKSDRYILWNIASIKIGKALYYDLEGDSRKILEDLGCEYKGKYKMLMTRMIGLSPDSAGVKNKVKHGNKWYKYEPIFVFYRP